MTEIYHTYNEKITYKLVMLKLLKLLQNVEQDVDDEHKDNHQQAKGE